MFSNLINPCTNMGIGARLASICENILARMASILSSIELAEGTLILSRSGAEPSGEPKFEEVAGKGEKGTLDPSSTHAMRSGGKQQNWVVDTWTRQSQKSW